MQSLLPPILKPILTKEELLLVTMKSFRGVARTAFQGPRCGRFIEAGANKNGCPGFSSGISSPSLSPWKKFSLVFIKPRTKDGAHEFWAIPKLSPV